MTKNREKSSFWQKNRKIENSDGKKWDNKKTQFSKKSQKRQKRKVPKCHF